MPLSMSDMWPGPTPEAVASSSWVKSRLSRSSRNGNAESLATLAPRNAVTLYTLSTITLRQVARKNEDPYNHCMPDTSQIGAILRDLRLSRNLVQSDMAEALGVTSPAISHIETGRRDTRVSYFYRWVERCNHEVRLVPKDAQGLVDVSHLQPHEAAMVAKFARIWGRLDSIQAEQLRLQIDLLDRVVASSNEEPMVTTAKHRG